MGLLPEHFTAEIHEMLNVLLFSKPSKILKPLGMYKVVKNDDRLHTLATHTQR
jgi:hypothetical protein